MEKKATIQELHLELIRRASFNNFDGERVVEDLLADKGLWQGVVMDRGAYGKDIDLIKLRDIPDNYWNVDTLFILAAEGKEEELMDLAKSWDADEVNWMIKPSLGGGDGKVLSVWWD